jgi:hypothetical protein
MLPVIVSTAQRKMLLRPDDLRPDVKAGLLERGGHLAGIEPGMPDVDDIAAKQFICLAPIDAIVVLHGPGLPLFAESGCFAPVRIVLDSVGWIGDTEDGNGGSAQALDIGRACGIAAQDAVFSAHPKIAT